MWRPLPTSRDPDVVVARSFVVHRFGAVLLTVVTASTFLQSPSVASAQAGKADPALYARATKHPAAHFGVIIRERSPGTSVAEALVRSLGGHVTSQLPIIRGFSAVVPGSAVATLTASPGVLRVWGDGRIHVA